MNTFIGRVRNLFKRKKEVHKEVHKKISAMRWAKGHGINVIPNCSLFPMSSKEGQSACCPQLKIITFNKLFNSQVEKDTSLWHEIGHYLDFQKNFSSNVSDYYHASDVNILKIEARASFIAVKLLQGYNQYSKKNRDFIYWAYGTYESCYPHLKSYRYLIEEAEGA